MTWSTLRRALAGVAVAASVGTATVALPNAASATRSQQAPVMPTLREAPRTWTIDANTLRVADPAEHAAWLVDPDGDEPYVGVIAYRSTVGTAGSTSAWFLGGLQELSSDARAGHVLTIPDAMGRATFPRVARRTASDIVAGRSPEVIGTITVTVESDGTPWSTVRSTFNDLAGRAREAVASVIETTSLSEFLSAGTDPALQARLAAKFRAAVDHLRSSDSGGIWQVALNLFAQLFDLADDEIDAKFTAFFAVAPALAPFVDPAVSNALTEDVRVTDCTVRQPPAPNWNGRGGQGTCGSRVITVTRGAGGALQPRSFSLTHSGGGATYHVDSTVSMT